MKTILIAAALAATLAGNAYAVDKNGFIAYSWGNARCGDAFTQVTSNPASANGLKIWIQGYLTAVNSFGLKGDNINNDPDNYFQAVLATCLKYPDETVGQSAWRFIGATIDLSQEVQKYGTTLSGVAPYAKDKLRNLK